MEAVFQTILQLSARASLVILAVLAVRFLLKKAPRKYSYLLWAVVGFRLICPVSFSSAVSIFNVFNRSEVSAVPTVEHTIDRWAAAPPTIPVPTVSVPAAVPAEAPAAVNWFGIAAVVWCIGIAALLGYAVISVLRLRRRLSTAVRLEGNVYQSESVASPFILGILCPRIYIPYGLEGQALSYVLAHERIHLRHGDPIVKLLAFALLAVHWFNPLVWLAFVLMSRDMEMRCDEAVLVQNGYSAKNYSETLLSFAVKDRFPAPVPLAFGETAVKGRIKNALRWKQPKLWVTVLAVLLCAAALVACGTSAKGSPLTAEEAMNALESSCRWEGKTLYFTIPEGYPTPENWKILLKEPGGVGYLHPVNQEKRTVWEAGKTYEVETDGLMYVDMVVRLPDENGEELRRSFIADRPFDWIDSAPSIGEWGSIADLRVYGVAMWDGREQIVEIMGREPDGETGDAYNNVLTYIRDDGATVTFYLFQGKLETIECAGATDWFGGEQLTLETAMEKLGHPSSLSFSQGDGVVCYSKTIDHRLGNNLLLCLGFTMTEDGAYQLDGTMGLRVVYGTSLQLGGLTYSENIYTTDWWVSIDPADYGITPEELASNPLPDFETMSLEALGAYALHTDGAGAEGAFHQFYSRFAASPHAVVEYLSSLGWSEGESGEKSVYTLSRALLVECAYENVDIPQMEELLADCQTDTDSRLRDLAEYLLGEYQAVMRWRYRQFD